MHSGSRSICSHRKYGKRRDRSNLDLATNTAHFLVRECGYTQTSAIKAAASAYKIQPDTLRKEMKRRRDKGEESKFLDGGGGIFLQITPRGNSS